MNPCNAGIQPLVDRVMAALKEAGAMPQVFGFPTVTDGIVSVSREVIADSIEVAVNGQRMDGVLAVGGCDKNMPTPASRASRPIAAPASVLPQRHGTALSVSRFAVERSPALMLAPLATVPADCTTGNGPAQRGAGRGARHVGGIERLARKCLAGLDPVAARHDAASRGPRGRPRHRPRSWPAARRRLEAAVAAP